VLVTVVLALFYGLLGQSSWEPVRSRVFDTYQSLAPRQVQALPVVIVDIDEASVTALGQWPWPRTRLARLIEATHQLGALAIGLNMLMPEADRLSPGVFMTERPDVSPALRHALAQLPANDTLLAETLQRTPTVVGRAGTSESQPSPVPVNDHRRVRTYGAPPLAYVQRYQGHVTNLPQLEQAASGHGYLNAEPDQDGVLRLVPLHVAVQEALAPTFVLELLRVAGGQEVYSAHADDHGIRGVQIGETLIHTDFDSRVRLYFSKTDARRRVSALHVLQGTVPAALVQNKIAIIGITALGLADVVSTPLAARMDGVELNAQALENILSNTRLVRPFLAPWLELVISLVANLIILLFLPRVGVVWRATIIIGMTLLITTSAFVAFSLLLLLIDPSFPSATMFIVYLIMVSGGELHDLINRTRHIPTKY
jgi:adenylate cyclase